MGTSISHGKDESFMRRASDRLSWAISIVSAWRRWWRVNILRPSLLQNLPDLFHHPVHYLRFLDLAHCLAFYVEHAREALLYLLCYLYAVELEPSASRA